MKATSSLCFPEPSGNRQGGELASREVRKCWTRDLGLPHFDTFLMVALIDPLYNVKVTNRYLIAPPSKSLT